MSLYLDTEFSAFHGRLISLALVSSDTGKSFYGVLPLPSAVHPWVREHVIPFLDQESEDEDVFRMRLAQYLRAHPGEPIYADWPEDFAHLMNYICEPNGMRPSLGDLTMYLISTNDEDIEPEVPHNALSDAKALMRWHKAQPIWGQRSS